MANAKIQPSWKGHEVDDENSFLPHAFIDK